MATAPGFDAKADISPTNFLPYAEILGLSRSLLLPLLDALCILIVPICQSLVTQVLAYPPRYLGFWGLLTLVVVLLTQSHGGYRCWQEHRMRAAKLAVRCFSATAVTMLTVAVLLGHEHAVSQHWTTLELILPPLLLVFTRSVTAASLVSAPADTGPLIVCLDSMPDDLPRELAEHNIASRPSGVLYLQDVPPDNHNPPWPVIPDVQALIEAVRTHNVRDVVFIYGPESEQLGTDFKKTLISELLGFPVRIWLAFSMDPKLLGPLAHGLQRCRLVPVANERLLNSLNPAKRLFDVVVGVLLLALCMPLLACIALTVRLSGCGSVVFRQRRTGAQGRQFTVLKFRTMSHAPSAPFTQAARSDRRVTRIGAFLRRTSLDELLQLVNVIRGEMSLVGPRPHAPETQVQGIAFEQAVQYYRLRHRVRPGMTGLAQIRGHRGQTAQLETLEQRIASDLEYIDTWSLWLDISIILRTLPTMINQRNAY